MQPVCQMKKIPEMSGKLWTLVVATILDRKDFRQIFRSPVSPGTFQAFAG